MPEINHKGHTLVIESAETAEGTQYYRVTDRNNGSEYEVAPSHGFFDGHDFVPDEVKEGVEKFHEEHTHL